ncbi:MAG TPA: nitrate reductase molybdenum cofactor assembly chaperone [Corynebacterium sp.]|nr:nitrate reductase molybdenum cofactor assembly chaperone [Corynebacterium sp.]
MGIFDKLKFLPGAGKFANSPPNARGQLPPIDHDALAGYGTPAGMGASGGAKDVERTSQATLSARVGAADPRRTHTGRIPAELISPVAVTEHQRRTTAMAVSVLLQYPDANFHDTVEAVEQHIAGLPPAIAEDFSEFFNWARAASVREVEEHYVETFDQRRRCSLFLSYYAVGDTRQRGMAILAFGQQLRALGFEFADDELPDHLCVVLEALGLSEGQAHDQAVEFVASYRDGLEVLRAALAHTGSPYISLIVALCKSLPQVDEETAQKYMDLIRTGPPAEVVGIADLPFPTVQPDDL